VCPSRCCVLCTYDKNPPSFFHPKHLPRFYTPAQHHRALLIGRSVYHRFYRCVYLQYCPVTSRAGRAEREETSRRNKKSSERWVCRRGTVVSVARSFAWLTMFSSNTGRGRGRGRVCVCVLHSESLALRVPSFVQTMDQMASIFVFAFASAICFSQVCGSNLRSQVKPNMASILNGRSSTGTLHRCKFTGIPDHLEDYLTSKQTTSSTELYYGKKRTKGYFQHLFVFFIHLILVQS